MSGLQTTAAVLRLLDESFRARQRGDQAECALALAAAARLDVDVVAAVEGGITIGEIPNPERHYEAWADYVAVVVGTAAAAAGLPPVP